MNNQAKILTTLMLLLAAPPAHASYIQGYRAAQQAWQGDFRQDCRQLRGYEVYVRTTIAVEECRQEAACVQGAESYLVRVQRTCAATRPEPPRGYELAWRAWVTFKARYPTDHCRRFDDYRDIVNRTIIYGTCANIPSCQQDALRAVRDAEQECERDPYEGITISYTAPLTYPFFTREESRLEETRTSTYFGPHVGPRPSWGEPIPPIGDFRRFTEPQEDALEPYAKPPKGDTPNVFLACREGDVQPSLDDNGLKLHFTQGAFRVGNGYQDDPIAGCVYRVPLEINECSPYIYAQIRAGLMHISGQVQGNSTFAANVTLLTGNTWSSYDEEVLGTFRSGFYGSGPYGEPIAVSLTPDEAWTMYYALEQGVLWLSIQAWMQVTDYERSSWTELSKIISAPEFESRRN